MTSSNTSKNSKQLDQIRGIKEITVLKGQPLIIVKLSRTINVFFFVMLLTATVLLIVNIEDEMSFHKGIQAVEDAFRIQFYVANIRLRFLYLLAMSNYFMFGNYTQSELQRVGLERQELGDFVEEFRKTINTLSKSVSKLDQNYGKLFSSPGMYVKEVSNIGKIRNLTVSFQSACQVIIEKADIYTLAPLEQLRLKRQFFGIDYNIPPPKNYTLGADEINSYFIIENLANSIKD